MYKSKLVGNRRTEHIALHNKAFQYDDPFWNTYYPPNGWECKCYVETRSEAGAKQEGIEVLATNRKGKLPSVPGVDWDTFADETWKYNVGRESLAPNFSKYKNLKEYEFNQGIRLKEGEKSVWDQAIERYRDDMDGTRLTQGEFITLLKRLNNNDYMPDRKKMISYQVGNVAEEQYKALREWRIEDSKVMSTDYQLWHGTGDKNREQKIPEKKYAEIYQLLQNPDAIYENSEPEHEEFGVEIHFIKDCEWERGKKIKIVLRVYNGVCLQVVTMGVVNDTYDDPRYIKVWEKG